MNEKFNEIKSLETLFLLFKRLKSKNGRSCELKTLYIEQETIV